MVLGVCSPQISYNTNVFWFFSCPFQLFRQFFLPKCTLFFLMKLCLGNRFHSFVFTVGAVLLIFNSSFFPFGFTVLVGLVLYSVFHFFRNLGYSDLLYSNPGHMFFCWKLPLDVSLIKVKEERNDFENVQKKTLISEGSIRMRIALFLRNKHENKSHWKTSSSYWFAFCFTWCYKNCC